MPRGRKPEAEQALSNAERQARFRARRQAPQPQTAIRRRPAADRRSRPQRWRDAVAELLTLQAEYARCRELIGMSKLEPTADAADKDYRDTHEQLTGVSLCQCPACHIGHMVLFRALRPFTQIPLIIDTS